MVGWSKWGAMTVGIALAMGAAPGAAFHEEPPLLLAEDIQPGSGWATFRILTDGSWFMGKVGSRTTSFPQYGLALLYLGDGTLLGGIASGLSGDDTLVHVEIPGAGVETSVEHPANLDGCDHACEIWIGLSYNDPEFNAPDPRYSGELLLVLATAGEQFDWFFELRGESGVTLLGLETGGPALFAAPADMDSTLGVEANALGYEPYAHAYVGSRLEPDIDETLIGLFTGNTDAGLQDVRVQRPDGVDASDRWCSEWTGIEGVGPNFVCWFTALAGTDQAGPGRYVLETTNAGASFSNMNLFGADLRMPS